VIENEEWIIDRSDGSRFNQLSNVAPIRDFAGQIIGGVIGLVGGFFGYLGRRAMGRLP
jgi:hypothetical protein